MRRTVCLAALGALLLMVLTLAACITEPTPYAPEYMVVLETPVILIDQGAVLTQEQNAVDIQAVATAEIVRANAQATLNSADATLEAAQTQQQNNANIIAAHVAATVEIERAYAQATLVAAASTQNAALTQDTIRQRQTADQATQFAAATYVQQSSNVLAAGTQTAIANLIATQTRSAEATSQWYLDQSRQRAERMLGPLAFLWNWCLPSFLVLVAGLLIWGLWRWLKIQQANQRIVELPVERLPAPDDEGIHHHQDDLLPYIESNVIDSQVHNPEPEEQDQVSDWMEDVKTKLLDQEEKDKDDCADN